MAVYELFVNDFFIMFQPGTLSNPSAVEVDQLFNMFDAAFSNHKLESIVQHFNVGQVVSVRTSIKNLEVFDFFAMSEFGVKSLPAQTITQIFAPWHSARTVLWEQVTQTLALTQTVLAPRAKPTVNTLVFVQAAIGNVVRAIEVEQDFVMRSHGVGYTLDPCNVPNPYVLGGPNGSPV